MTFRIALIGNPNSGKTTMFNGLTGSSQRVGNWPGVTVDRKEGKLKGFDDVEVVDLPGIYSLSPYSPEEIVSRDYLLKENPDAVINIVDATNLERNLYLSMQVLDLGIPVVIALNMMDAVEKRGDKIDVKGLEKCLGCSVIPTSALKNTGSREVAEKAVEIGKLGRREPKKVLSKGFEKIINDIEDIIAPTVGEEDRRWYAVKLFEKDEVIVKEMEDRWDDIEPIISAYEKEMDDDSESIVTNERYDFIVKIVRKNLKKNDVEYVSSSDKIDRIVTNRWLALPIFALVIIAVYYISITTVGGYMTDWVNDVFFGEWVLPGVEDFLTNAGVDAWLTDLITNGIIGGVGAVLGFLPQMVVLFVFLIILEDCGYMARVAFIMDRVFRRFGLSGKSLIPAIVGTGCGIPGIMASRTIESESDRKITVMTTTFMPCSAKLPIIALIAGAITNLWWVAPASYFIGIVAMLMSGIILKKFRKFMGRPSPFIMELPEYHSPRVMTVATQTLQRAWMFVRKAGTIVLLSSVIIWILMSFDTSFTYGPDIDDSILAELGNLIAGVFAPLGFGDWQSTVATITGLVAKENIVATLGVMLGFEGAADGGASAVAAHFTQLSALSFLIFNLLCAPCFAAIGAMRRELGTWRATGMAVLYQCLFAYAIVLIVYQFGLLLTGAGWEWWIVMAIAALAIMVFLLLRKEDSEERSLFGTITRRDQA